VAGQVWAVRVRARRMARSWDVARARSRGQAQEWARALRAALEGAMGAEARALRAVAVRVVRVKVRRRRRR